MSKFKLTPFLFAIVLVMTLASIGVRAEQDASADMMFMVTNLANNLSMDSVRGYCDKTALSNTQIAITQNSEIARLVKSGKVIGKLLKAGLKAALNAIVPGLGEILTLNDLYDAYLEGDKEKFIETVAKKIVEKATKKFGADWVQKKLSGETAKKIAGKIYDWFVEQNKDEIYQKNYKDNRGCDFDILAKWSKRSGKLFISVNGNCHCAKQSDAVNLNRDYYLKDWSFLLDAKVTFSEYSADIPWDAKPVSARGQANCCQDANSPDSLTPGSGKPFYLYKAPAPPPAEPPPTTTPPQPPPVAPPPPPPDPNLEKGRYLNECASRMEDFPQQYQNIQKNIGDARGELGVNKLEQEKLGGEIAVKEKDLGDFIERNTIKIYQNTNTGQMVESTGTLGPPFELKGDKGLSKVNEEKAKAKRKEIDGLKSKQADLKKRGTDLGCTITSGQSSLQDWRERVESSRKDCGETYNELKAKGYYALPQEAQEAMDRYEKALGPVEKLLKTVPPPAPPPKKEKTTPHLRRTRGDTLGGKPDPCLPGKDTNGSDDMSPDSGNAGRPGDGRGGNDNRPGGAGGGGGGRPGGGGDSGVETPPQPEITETQVTVCKCKPSEYPFKKQTINETVESSNTSVVTARLHDGRLEVTAKKHGRATVTVKGEVVRYNMGFPDQPPRGSGRGPHSVPLNGNYPFMDKVVVNVVCDLNGHWRGPAGTVRITDDCGKITLQAKKSIYTGTAKPSSKGYGKIKLTHSLSLDEVGKNMPEEARQTLVGRPVIIEGRVSEDEETIEADFIMDKVEWKKQEDGSITDIRITGQERTPVTFTRKR